MTGVVEPLGYHFTTGASSATKTNIGDVVPKSIRRIWRLTDSPYTVAAAHAQMMVTAGKYVVPTFQDNTGFGSLTSLQRQAEFALFADKFQGIVDVIELVNEVPDGMLGGYFTWVREAAPIFETRGIGLLLSSGTGRDPSYFDACEANDVWNVPNVVGVCIHPYLRNPGTNLTTTGTQLHNIKIRRDQLVSFGEPAASLPFYITEFGWCTQGTTGSPGSSVLVASEAIQQANLNQAFTNWETHAETLKIKVAHWFCWHDYNTKNSQEAFNFCGIRTDESTWPSGPQNPPPWRYKNGGGQSGTTGIKATLDSFGEGTVAVVGAAPEVVTLDPPNAIDQDSAILTGTTDPNDLPTTYHYEYSTNPLPASDPDAMPVGFVPLSNAAAAAKVVAHPVEQRSMNAPENAAMPSMATVNAWRASSPAPQSTYSHLVNGQYTGTTDEILQWAARKWGFHPDVFRAVAVKESYWDQGQLGDPHTQVSQGGLGNTTLASAHALPTTPITVASTTSFVETVERIIGIGPAHSSGDPERAPAPTDYMNFTGKTGTTFTGCTAHTRFKPGSGNAPDGSVLKGDFNSYGILQTKRPYHWTTPYIALVRDHTAFVADYFGSILRSYYNGRETWLNAYDPPGYTGSDANGLAYPTGDRLWGAIGAWFSGRWHDAGATGYIGTPTTSGTAKYNLETKPWLGGGF